MVEEYAKKVLEAEDFASELIVKRKNLACAEKITQSFQQVQL